jgi:hypothetical protein
MLCRSVAQKRPYFSRRKRRQKRILLLPDFFVWAWDAFFAPGIFIQSLEAA